MIPSEPIYTIGCALHKRASIDITRQSNIFTVYCSICHSEILKACVENKHISITDNFWYTSEMEIIKNAPKENM